MISNIGVMLNLHRLRLLHAFRLRGTVSAAAEAMGLSPSTVSQQLTQLERDASAELFHRSGRTLRLTPAGVRLAEHARMMLDLEDEALRSLSAGEPELSGVLRLSVFQSVALTLAPAALSRLKADHPDLRVEVVQAPPEQALFDLAGRRHDVVVAEQYPGVSRPRQAEFDSEVLGTDRLWVVVPAPLAGTAPEDLDAYPWVMEPPGTASREWCVQQCRALGFEPDVRFTTDDLLSHLQLIRAGLAVGILPELLLKEQDTDDVALLPLPQAPARTIYTTARRSSAETPAAQACRTALREAFTDATQG
ncbi:LysR family transcriptional regulator [Nesterenkonia flava]|uniref:LysR family transcriptional regulator n=1 Tax=Nesterenkonia flava TaxID=469799 RepID=A0ABU1FUQ2_9MICC|nr:LysR family transcriptional regulator [Nesterenkonia flava]MDR5711918.1 LysR family transcriptional regulator [Nesterenkonia flava]